MSKFIESILKKFIPEPTPLQGYLSVVELLSTVIMAALSGGGILGVLMAVQAALPSILVDQTWMPLVGLILTFIINVYRKTKQGEPAPTPSPEPKPVPTPTPTPAPEDNDGWVS